RGEEAGKEEDGEETAREEASLALLPRGLGRDPGGAHFREEYTPRSPEGAGLRVLHPVQQVSGDLLDARVRALRLGAVRLGVEIPRRGGQAVGPPAGRGIEH